MSTLNGQPPITVAIIGGGLSGAAVAYHLAGLVGSDLRAIDLVVIEPRADLGRGIAYATPDPDHRLNVPDHKMTLRSDQPEDFRRWLHTAEAPSLPANSARLSGEIYAPRAVFGTYVAAQLRPLQAAGRLRHLQARVVSVARTERYALGLSDGSALMADIVVLAATHPNAGLPRELAALSGGPALIADPFAEGALAGIGADERVLIVGNGLTSADIVASLHRRGHRGQITALSRHGHRSMPHGPVQAESAADFAAAPAGTALQLLRRVRAGLAQDVTAGLTWHAVFDQLRRQGPTIWAALPEAERRRFLRHLRSLWDIHRFRIAPQTYEANQQMQRLGRLTSLAARIVSAKPGNPVKLGLRARGSGVRFGVMVDRVILATGPAHGGVIAATPALADLAALGLLQADPLGLGLLTAADGRAVPLSGAPDGTLLVAGPLARAAVGELMGVPEVITWAEHIARQVVGQVAVRRGLVAAQ